MFIRTKCMNFSVRIVNLCKYLTEEKKEFLEELEQLINTKIYEINFSNQESKNIISEIKKKKLEAIKAQMLMYEKNEMKKTGGDDRWLPEAESPCPRR